ncbi:hypothetical protein GXW82_10475 [Streptacidiphilus sp. 4-A2]|nr:hypothetical protein [Streptacidiphilus sp. 4-A2]
MHVISFSMSCPDGVSDEARRILTPALTRSGEEQKGFEHLRVHTSRAGARGVMFLIAPAVDRARLDCLAICERAIATTAELAGWTAALHPPKPS